MQANFYYNESDPRYMNKNITLKYGNIPIEVLTPTSVVMPTLKVSSGLIGQSVNYVYVPSLERYYFIKNWNMENGYIKIDCEVDVLMSFKNEIKAQNVIVKRNEKKFNMYLEDDQYKLLNQTAVRTLEFPNGFDDHQLVMGIVGKKVNTT